LVLSENSVFHLFPLCFQHPERFWFESKKSGAEIGMTMVLHTHNRRLDFHPHIHIVLPGGGVDKRRRQWKKKKGKYLFNKEAMAKVFRARFLAALNQASLSIPKSVAPNWVVDCAHVGKGITALKYLSRYLYRGVISEKNYEIINFFSLFIG
jgi:hypothetical protein